MKELIDKEYAEGRNTVMSDKELHAMFKKVAPERYNKIKKIKKIRQKLIET